jgi:transcriptional regulator with XRE-family HTH domain
MKFHEFVSSRREKLLLNKKELAERAGISDAYIKHIEDGMRIPKDMIILYKLADALKVNREWFRDFAYFNRDSREASKYLNEEFILQGEMNGRPYMGINLSSQDKELLQAIEGLGEDQKKVILHYLQGNATFDGLIFEGQHFNQSEVLYRIVDKLAIKDDGFLRKVLNYLTAILYIEEGEEKLPLYDMLEGVKQ